MISSPFVVTRLTSFPSEFGRQCFSSGNACVTFSLGRSTFVLVRLFLLMVDCGCDEVYHWNLFLWYGGVQSSG